MIYDPMHVHCTDAAFFECYLSSHGKIQRHIGGSNTNSESSSVVVVVVVRWTKKNFF